MLQISSSKLGGKEQIMLNFAPPLRLQSKGGALGVENQVTHLRV